MRTAIDTNILRSDLKDALKAAAENFVAGLEADIGEHEITLAEAKKAIADNGWTVSTLNLSDRLTLDDVNDAISENGWDRDDLNMAVERCELASLIRQFGTDSMLSEVLDVTGVDDGVTGLLNEMPADKHTEAIDTFVAYFAGAAERDYDDPRDEKRAYADALRLAQAAVRALPEAMRREHFGWAPAECPDPAGERERLKAEVRAEVEREVAAKLVASLLGK